MSLVQIKNKAQVTLPAKIRKELGLEVGDYLEAEIEERSIKLKPVKVVDKSEARFYTKEWQEGERRANEDLKSGQYTEYDNVDDLIDSLE